MARNKKHIKGDRAELIAAEFFIEKGFYSGLGGAAGAQTAAPLEAMVQSMLGQTDMQTFVEEKYGNMSDWAKHALMETIQFSLIGFSHMATGKSRKADFALTMQGKKNLQMELLIDIMKMESKGKRSDLEKNDSQYINKVQLYQEVSKQIKVSENRERYLNKDILIGLAIINPIYFICMMLGLSLIHI